MSNAYFWELIPCLVVYVDPSDGDVVCSSTLCRWGSWGLGYIDAVRTDEGLCDSLYFSKYFGFGEYTMVRTC